tara:strand:- start:1826 stop:2044 length:219 start_codon:yes stop_codon:yes gene_type:complete
MIIYKSSGQLPKHGSPQDRGSADRYYQRPYKPHWWPDGTGKGLCVFEDEMDSSQIEEYHYGWANEDDRKDWG